MNKQEYLFKLERALKAAHVKDSHDILDEYGQHFDLKIADGYSEEEIAARLIAPEDIASQFQGIEGEKRTGAGLIPKIALVFAGFFAGTFFLLLYAWVFVLGVFSISAAVAGILLITGINAWQIIPQMPFYCSVLCGIWVLALAVLSAIGTLYCHLYSVQLLRAYVRWHKSVFTGNCLPPTPIYPSIQAKKRRLMRNTALVSVAVFAVGIIISYVAMSITAGAFEFWHAWHWFE